MGANVDVAVLAVVVVVVVVLEVLVVPAVVVAAGSLEAFPYWRAFTHTLATTKDQTPLINQSITQPINRKQLDQSIRKHIDQLTA